MIVFIFFLKMIRSSHIVVWCYYSFENYFSIFFSWLVSMIVRTGTCHVLFFSWEERGITLSHARIICIHALNMLLVIRWIQLFWISMDFKIHCWTFLKWKNLHWCFRNHHTISRRDVLKNSLPHFIFIPSFPYDRLWRIHPLGQTRAFRMFQWKNFENYRAEKYDTKKSGWK